LEFADGASWIDILCSEGINPLLELAFQLKNNFSEKMATPLFMLEQSRRFHAALRIFSTSPDRHNRTDPLPLARRPILQKSPGDQWRFGLA
jgi:hypothetical protein